ncbi:hypothetical protein [Nocardia carnea]|uniref:hypothetical protein n=1 Tax=Nocardia carnea TaxID=37328 RepID=UPI0024572C42|nr:hypothetical protein [Nocardia carnea]
MRTPIPWRQPLPEAATLWVDEYWRVQPVELTALNIDGANQIHADYEFRTSAGMFAGHLASPPVVFDAVEGPYLHTDFSPPTGLSERQFKPIWDQMLHMLIDWDPGPGDRIQWEDPLPGSASIDLDSGQQIRFDEIVVRDDRISARYEIHGSAGAPRGGQIQTPRVIFDRSGGPDYSTEVQLIDGLDDNDTDTAYTELLFELVRWEDLAAVAWQRLADHIPTGLRMVSLSVWQEEQSWGANPDKPWWRSITYANTDGVLKVAVDGPDTSTVFTLPSADLAHRHPPVLPQPRGSQDRSRIANGKILDADDAIVLDLLTTHVDPTEIHQWHYTEDDVDTSLD